MSAEKSLKDYAKDAKRRLKSSFWENYKSKIDYEVSLAEKEGVSASKVKEYYQNKASITVRGTKTEDEDFYLKVNCKSYKLRSSAQYFPL